MSSNDHVRAEEARKKKRKKKKGAAHPKHKKQIAAGNAPGDDGVSINEKKSPPPPQSGIQRVAVKQPSTAHGLGKNATGSTTFVTSASPQLAVAPEDIPKGNYGHLVSTRRVEQLCQSLGLSHGDIAKLRRIFACEDLHGDGEITPDEFFTIIGEDKRKLTAGIFEYVGLQANPRRLSFDDFVLCAVMFSAYSREELMLYAFTLFDKDDSGAMDASELSAFCGDLKNRQFFFGKNVETAQKKLADKETRRPDAIRDGLVDLEDLTKGSSRFQAAFYPILQMQRNIRAATLGESFWETTVLRKQRVEVIVHYMRLHGGKLPPLSIQQRLRSLLHPDIYLIRRAAVLKHAEELRQRKEQEELQRQKNKRGKSSSNSKKHSQHRKMGAPDGR